jgi:hypothetical protein
MALPMLIKLSAMTPRPTHRFMPAITLMRPSHPVRHYVEFRTMSRILVLALLFGRFRNNYTT